MHIHILGIGGTFMGSLALLAQARGHRVTGSDAKIYPPMSEQLRAAKIIWSEGYNDFDLLRQADLIIVGNAISRGNPALEYVLENRIPYTSGPSWLDQDCLAQRSVLAVSGTHGKTTTTSMLAWILEYAGYDPSFLIGGVPLNFGYSAKLGAGKYFVIEADEYDTAFFDKRSKFLHYHPDTLVINNIEFDHADIFKNLAEIQQQFHYLIRTLPASSLIIHPAADHNISETLAKGCWSRTQTFTVQTPVAPQQFSVNLLKEDGSVLEFFNGSQSLGQLTWGLWGRHNAHNALAALLAAQNVGIELPTGIQALTRFKGVARRLSLISQQHDIRIYDDFAHHPTAISTTLQGLRAHAPQRRILLAMDFRSYTMRSGVHCAALPQALNVADQIYLYHGDYLSWDPQVLTAQLHSPARISNQLEQLIQQLAAAAQPGDNIVIMSNGDFGNIHQKLLAVMQEKKYEVNNLSN